MVTRRDILEAAHMFMGTSFMHRQKSCGLGVDCLGLVIGVYEYFCGNFPIEIPSYTPMETHIGLDPYALGRVLILTPKARLGSVLVFHFPKFSRWHFGILMDEVPNTHERRFMHADTQKGVILSHFSPYWERRVCAVFDFPFLDSFEN